MDIRARVEARKAELRHEQECLAAEAKARAERVREVARAEAQKRVAILDADDGDQASAALATSTGEAPTEEDIERELDAALNAKANDMWTSGENTTLLILILGTIGSFFVLGWVVGLTLVVVTSIYFGMKNGKYKRQLREELAKREGLAG